MNWLRNNLFNSPLNSLLTLASLGLLWLLLPPLVGWALVDADFHGSSRADCGSGGACWVFVINRLDQFLYGLYPLEQRWRVNCVLLAPLLFIVLARSRRAGRIRNWAAAIGLFIVVATWLLHGGWGLPVVETTRWGGLMLTLVVAAVGMACSLPLGILLALGRQSELPVVRAVCVAFIEFWRGVPLITVLFMASVMLPLFLPEGVSFDKLLRALIGVTLFESAYMAEVVRGGLQAIPRGQYEAAAAIGLGYWRRMGLVVLPQALRLVIPGIVNTFIALFKDTTLVLIIGLFDLLGMVQAAIADPAWLGYSVEGYVFAAAVFWLFCFGMSRYSQALEARLDQTTHERN
ncbi:MAG: amino acid ABC transporter permease [Gammaproteobacteria bacterium]|jgi:general L-amino acid transport system permease protein|nr:amino acid ABC transporter permease [Gammaproteobacteria bacterium]